MIIEKAPPVLRRWLAMANHVLGDGGLGYGYAKLRQLAVHAGSAPERIALLISRISSRISLGTPGRPGRRRWLFRVQ